MWNTRCRSNPYLHASLFVQVGLTWKQWEMQVHSTEMIWEQGGRYEKARAALHRPDTRRRGVVPVCRGAVGIKVEIFMVKLLSRYIRQGSFSQLAWCRPRFTSSGLWATHSPIKFRMSEHLYKLRKDNKEVWSSAHLENLGSSNVGYVTY